MPRRRVIVSSHDRSRPRGPGRVHVDRYSRTHDIGARQYDLEEVLGPEHDILNRNDPDGETCSRCGYRRPVHQRDVAGRAVCRECYDLQHQQQLERRTENEKRDRAADARLREWDRWQQGNPTIRRTGPCQGNESE